MSKAEFIKILYMIRRGPLHFLFRGSHFLLFPTREEKGESLPKKAVLLSPPLRTFPFLRAIYPVKLSGPRPTVPIKRNIRMLNRKRPHSNNVSMENSKSRHTI